MLRRAVAALAVVAASMVSPGGADIGADWWCPPAAASAGQPGGQPNRAVVVVDTGDEVVRRCVEFTEESITGLEALERAGFEPITKSFGDMGSFVCRILDTGCPAANCQCSDTYWAYARADDGAADFTVSEIGASASEVTDGDVEGWKWSKGEAPEIAGAQEVCDGGPSEVAAPRRDPPPGDDDDRAGPLAAAGFVGVLLVIGASIALMRRRRRSP